MTTDEVIRLTRTSIREILDRLPHEEPTPYEGAEQRQHPRWPSQGTVELRPLFSRQKEGTTGTVRNISEAGLGMSSGRYFEPNSVQEIIVHMGHASFSAKACVRYCKKVRDEYMAGLAFMFEE